MPYSLGATINSAGQVTAVTWQRPLFNAGVERGQQIAAVNGVAFTVQRLKTAVTENEKGGHPIALLMKDGDRYRSVTIDYRDGLRYPHLERDASIPARLDDILKSRR